MAYRSTGPAVLSATVFARLSATALARVAAALLVLVACVPSTHAGRYPAPVHVLELLGPAAHVLVVRIQEVRTDPVPAPQQPERALSAWVVQALVEAEWRGTLPATSGVPTDGMPTDAGPSAAEQPEPLRVAIRVASPHGNRSGAAPLKRTVGSRYVVFLPSPIKQADGLWLYEVEDSTYLQAIDAKERVILSGISGLRCAEGSSALPLAEFRAQLDAYLAPAYRAEMIRDLRHGTSSSQGWAIRQLARLGASEVVPDLLREITHDAGGNARMAAAWIGRIQDPRIAPALVANLAMPAGRSAAHEAIMALRGANKRRAVPALLDLLVHTDRDTRDTADGLLRILTKKPFPYSPAAWRAWWAEARGRTPWLATPPR